MDERIKNLDTPKKCEIFANNALTAGREDLAKQARARAIQLKAEAYGAETSAEKEAIEAVYAYEEVLSAHNGKKTRASRTWPMIQKYRIINTVERAVNRKAETKGYTALLEMGLEAYAFEAIILRYPELFSESAVEISQQRMKEWENV